MALKWWRRLVPDTPRRRARPTFRPEVVPLEDRCLPAAPITLIPGPTIDISQRAGTQNNPSITVNPVNPTQLFDVSNDGGDLLVSVSSDGGATWSIRTIANGVDALPQANALDPQPQAAFDSFGNLFVVYLDTTSTVRLILSTNGGQSFATLPPPGSAISASRPTIATGPGDTPGSGSVWVAWVTAAPSGPIVARGARVTGLIANPATFVYAVNPLAVTIATTATAPSIAIGPGGQVLVAYDQAPAVNPATAPGSIFTALNPTGVSGGSAFAAPVLATGTNVGNNYPLPANVPVTPGTGIDPEPRLAWDRTGLASNNRVYLVYTDASGVGSTDTDIVLLVSTNNGTNWSPASGFGRVNDDATANSQFLPAIALDQATGNVGITWYDARRDAGAGSPANTDGLPNTDVEYWGTVSLDGGRSFLPNVKISAGSSNSVRASSLNGLGKYTGLAFLNNTLYPAWADNSFGLAGNPAPTFLDVATSVVRLTGAVPGGPALSNFVAQAYLDILGRPADIFGLTFFTNFLLGGGSRSDVVFALVNSVEYRTRLIQGFYQSLLGRPADALGLNTFLNLTGNIPIFLADVECSRLENVRARILASNEYFLRNGGTNDAFLSALYRDVLGRPIDPSGQATYGALLASGASRLSVALAVINSVEADTLLINSLYARFLHRTPDPVGFNFFLHFLQQGGSEENIIIALVASEEYFIRFTNGT